MQEGPTHGSPTPRDRETVETGPDMGPSLFLRLFHARGSALSGADSQGHPAAPGSHFNPGKYDCPSGGENGRLRGLTGYAIG